MKKYVSSFLILASFMSSVPCFALVRELARCTTADGQYTVFIIDNQGIGPIRESRVHASISDSEGNTVATYLTEYYKGARSISFGRPQYRDTSTKGQGFSLQGPSTNYPNYSLKAEMNVGRSSGTISDENMNCSMFAGTLIQN